jgi:multicomponent Na+:H+ antiporter subunit D
MTEHLIILAIVYPLFVGVLTALLPCRPRGLAVWGIIHLLVGNVISSGLVVQALQQKEVLYLLSGWEAPLGIQLRATVFSALLSWLISTVSLIGFLGGRDTWEKQIGERLPHFLALFFLLVAAFQGLCLSNDAFNLYVMLEISSLATYGLIAFGGGRAYLATFHYIVMGTIGASFYLIGVGYLYIKTGTLNITDLAGIIADATWTNAYILALGFLIVGLLLKMAVFPLHLWLPNAYTYAPDATSVLVAPLSTKLAVFLMFRVMMDIFGGTIPDVKPSWSTFMVLVASFGILAGTSLSLAQRDIKKIFACLIVAEAGYMLGGLWMVDSRGTVGALFHLVNDAIATLVLFLVVMAVQTAVGGRNLGHISGLFRKSPLTAAALIVVAFNLIGVPPFAGFFSKVALITGAIASGRPEFVVALLLASLGNLVIFFRILERAFFLQEEPFEEKMEREKEADGLGLLALLVGLFLLVLGLNSNLIMDLFIRPVVLL